MTSMTDGGAPPTDTQPVHRSPWTAKQRCGRFLWSLVQATLFRCSLHNAYRWRATLLRLFGATLGHNARVRRTVRIEIPWHLTIGGNSSVGDFAILYSLGPINLGKHVTISQYAHLCAGTHETNSLQMELICLPVKVNDDAWIATDAFVGPGVTVGARTILGARSSAFKDLPPDVIAVGNPAKPIKPRVLSHANDQT